MKKPVKLNERVKQVLLKVFIRIIRIIHTVNVFLSVHYIKKKYGCVMDITMKPPANKHLTEILCQ